MRIKVAKSAGFCFGVDRAVNLVEKLVDSGEKVCTLGPIIHNMQMVGRLAEKGVRTVHSPKEANGDEVVVVRCHGVAQSVTDEIGRLGLRCKDATCPFVTKIHKIVSSASAGNIPVLIAGDKEHPEVQGIIGHGAVDCYTFKNQDELEQLLKIIPIQKNNEIFVVAQTTFDIKEWKKCLNTLKKVYTNAKIFDTICNATSERQAEADFLSQSSDVMIVIGDRHSSNSKKLFDICKGRCENTYFVETSGDLPVDILRTANSVGVTAGASTPATIIKEVLDTMSEINNKSGETIEIEENFEAMLEESLKNLNTNERVMGTVVSIAPNEVYVDVGRKQAGYVPLSELTNNPNLKPEDVVKVGDEIELLIMKTNDQEGTIMLSKRRVDAQKGWEELERLADSDQVLTGEVIEVVNGGVIVLYNDVRVFIPASQATAYRDESLEDLLKTTVDFRLLEVSQKGRRRRIVGSIRSVLKEQRAEQKAAFWNEAEIGKTYTGVVKSLTNYGAFVDLGGVFGMIHISELSWGHIKHPSDVVNVDDTVEVYIKDINTETNKISLGFKKAEDNPWEIMKNKYPEGTDVEAKIVGMTTFGAFANIIPGIDGLIHISQIANERIEKPQDVLKVGQTVQARITGIDFDKKRVSLSMKALLAPEEVPADETVVVATTEETPAEPETTAEAPQETPAAAETEAPAEAEETSAQ